jgi:hypothetical protein
MARTTPIFLSRSDSTVRELARITTAIAGKSPRLSRMEGLEIVSYPPDLLQNLI